MSRRLVFNSQHYRLSFLYDFPPTTGLLGRLRYDHISAEVLKKLPPVAGATRSGNDIWTNFRAPFSSLAPFDTLVDVSKVQEYRGQRWLFLRNHCILNYRARLTTRNPPK